jgi:type VI protein secretion system component VasF
MAIVAALALAACDNKPAEPSTTPETTTTEPATPAAPTDTPASMGSAPNAMAPSAMTPDAAMQALQEQAAKMTPEQKQQTVDAARQTAEQAARSQGLTDDQVKQAGDLAEQTIKQSLGM